MHYRETEKKKKKKSWAGRKKMQHGKEWDGGFFTALCSVPLLSSVGVYFSPIYVAEGRVT